MAHDTDKVCKCVSKHSPKPQELQMHHIRPQAQNGSDHPDNLVWLCPTTHTNVHELYRALVFTGGNVPWYTEKKFSRYTRKLAYEGYRRWKEGEFSR